MTLLDNHVITANTSFFAIHQHSNNTKTRRLKLSTSTMIEGEDLLLCVTCGTQFDTPASDPPSGYCRICNVRPQICILHSSLEYPIAHKTKKDPRQYIPASGQAWTSLKAETGKHETKWKQDEYDGRIWSIWAEPKVSQAVFLCSKGKEEEGQKYGELVSNA
jgi:hypothetical protein